MSEDPKTPNEAEVAPAADAKPAKAKKEKAPALEDKPFADFIRQDYLPTLQDALVKQGIPGAELTFEKRKVNITGLTNTPECWQVIGQWNSGVKQTREFVIYFFDEDIKGQKGFSYAENGGRPSTLESFMIDERKVDLTLLLLYTLQRLNGQKWLVRN